MYYFIIYRGNDDNSEDSESAEEGSSLQAYFPVTCTGQQPNSDVFVFGPTLQFDTSGNLIPLAEQRYIWIPQILEKLHRVVNPLTVIPYNPQGNALKDVVLGIQQLTGENIFSGVTLLGNVGWLCCLKTMGTVLYSSGGKAFHTL